MNTIIPDAALRAMEQGILGLLLALGIACVGLVMISSSLLDHTEIPVSVPKAANGGENAPKASALAMDVDRKIYLDGRESDSARVTAALREQLSRDSSHQVLIAANQRLLYEDVVRMLDWVKGSGVRKYALKVSRAE